MYGLTGTIRCALPLGLLHAGPVPELSAMVLNPEASLL